MLIYHSEKAEFEAIREVSQMKIDLVRQRLEEVGQQIREAWTQLQAENPVRSLLVAREVCSPAPRT